MIMKKGQTFIVEDRRKGLFKGIALEDFDTETSDFYPVATLQYVKGAATDWDVGEPIPCRKGISKIISLL